MILGKALPQTLQMTGYSCSELSPSPLWSLGTCQARASKISLGETGQRSALVVPHSIGLGETDWPPSIQMRTEISRGEESHLMSPAEVSVSCITEQTPTQLFHFHMLILQSQQVASKTCSYLGAKRLWER